MEYEQRLARFRRRLAAEKLDGFLISCRENIRYLSGFPGDDSWAVVSGHSACLITDFRYREEAETVLPSGWEMILRDSRPLAETAVSYIGGCQIRRLGFESRRLMFSDYDELNRYFQNNPGMEFIPAGEMIESARMIKDNDEIELIRRAAEIGDRVLADVRRTFQIGMNECEFASLLTAGIRASGGSPGFEPIVACGPRSSRPHARASDNPISSGEILLVDMGVNYRGYNSDMTRTFFVGEIPGDFERIYLCLIRARRAAMDTIAAGRTTADADAAARDFISSHGYGRFFGHALGHGVGLEIHEKPSLSVRSRELFREGMIFTVEPGIYLPGRGGIRIEDTVLLASDGCRALTKFSKDLNSMVITEH